MLFLYFAMSVFRDGLHKLRRAQAARGKRIQEPHVRVHVAHMGMQGLGSDRIAVAPRILPVKSD